MKYSRYILMRRLRSRARGAVPCRLLAYNDISTIGQDENCPKFRIDSEWLNSDKEVGLGLDTSINPTASCFK